MSISPIALPETPGAAHTTWRGNVSRLLSRWDRPLRHGALLACAVWIIAIGMGWFQLGTDARAYWLTGTTPWYEVGYGQAGAFVYSPAVGQFLGPFVALPWPIFSALWALVLLASLFAMGGRLTWALLLLPPVAFELYAGNIHLLLATAIVVGFRYPAAWAFVLLTKVTPGVGLLWFAARREWRNLAIALGTTAAVAAVSYLIDPELWVRWLDFIASATGAPVSYPHLAVPLLVRLPICAALVVWAALTDRRWVVPVAAMFALPVIWPGSLVMLLAILPLTRNPDPGAVPGPVRLS